MLSKVIIPLLLASILIASCSKSESEEKNCTAVDYEETFSIVEGERYCFPDEAELKVVGFRNEFCPCEAVCVWEGQMVVEMEWQFPGDTLVQFEYFSSENTAFPNVLSNGYKITDLEEDIVFEEACSLSNPSPKIIGAKILLSK